MRTEQPGIAYQAAKVGSAPLGYWPAAGIFSIAYRLANFRVSRLGAVISASMFFYIA